MRSLAIVLLFTAVPAGAQTTNDRAASDAESRMVADVLNCFIVGLPENWRQATMDINLAKAYDETGSVRYVFTREENTTPTEPFEPCDLKRPAQYLIELRSKQPESRRGWIGAQVTILRDGRFGIRYGYPKPNP
ncbi:MAG TPA: hypothetical protein VN675_09535 [Burkholderiales bacterium]|nr:hypothetical protein [Burkholderiales bacterium]